jgi:hypothetical protein
VLRITSWCEPQVSELIGPKALLLGRRCRRSSSTLDAAAPLLTEGLTNRLARRGTASGFALVSCLTARWTLSSAASGQDVPGQECDDDDCRGDSDDGDGGGGYDHAAILASSSGVETRRRGGRPRARASALRCPGDHDLSPNQPTTRNRVASTIPPEAELGQTERVPEVEHVAGKPEDDWPQQTRRGKGGKGDDESAGDAAPSRGCAATQRPPISTAPCSETARPSLSEQGRRDRPLFPELTRDRDLRCTCTGMNSCS